MSRHTDAPFENMRRQLEVAVEQILDEMSDQRANYAVPDSGTAVDLIRAQAAVEESSPWRVWRTMALRHLLPIHWMVSRLTTPQARLSDVELATMKKRLRDVLGYSMLGLIMVQDEEQRRHGEDRSKDGREKAEATGSN